MCFREWRKTKLWFQIHYTINCSNTKHFFFRDRVSCSHGQPWTSDIVKGHLDLLTFLSLLLRPWDYRCVPPHPVSVMFEIKCWASHMLGWFSTNWVSSLAPRTLSLESYLWNVTFWIVQSALGRWRPEDPKFKGILCYTATSRSTWAIKDCLQYK